MNKNFRDQEIGSLVEYNGVKIPNECDCIWCGSKMKRGGDLIMGSGVNQFALWCNNCGAVLIHAKEYGRKINGCSIKFEFDDGGGE